MKDIELYIQEILMSGDKVDEKDNKRISLKESLMI